MRLQRQHWWLLAKALLGLAIVLGAGWRFAGILRRPELWERPLSPRYPWLLVAGLSYLGGLGLSACFWQRLLVAVGERPPFLATIRAYYFGHLGKYVPGKAWGLFLRTGMIADAGVRPAVGALTTTYETLTTMASGALVAVLLLALCSTDTATTWWAFGLLALAALPILPVVFNPLMKLVAAMAARAARRFGGNTAAVSLPAVRTLTLLGGLAMTSIGWVLLGFSLLSVVQAILPDPPPWSFDLWARCTAYAALAWVAGFMFIPAPGGMGVREAVLEILLKPELRGVVPAEDLLYWTVLVVLWLRLLWTGAEIIMVCLVYRLPVRAAARADGLEPLPPTAL